MSIWALVGCLFGCIYLGVFIFSCVRIYRDILETEIVWWKKLVYPIIFSLVYVLAVILFTPMLVVIFPFAFLQEWMQGFVNSRK